AWEGCVVLWLGFEQDVLARCSSSAGLVTGESLYVGLRIGFQIQVRHFQRPAGDTHHR
ncbi:ArsR family transcriptional regulator, partial [Pseudomonas iridis]